MVRPPRNSYMYLLQTVAQTLDFHCRYRLDSTHAIAIESANATAGTLSLPSTALNMRRPSILRIYTGKNSRRSITRATSCLLSLACATTVASAHPSSTCSHVSGSFRSPAFAFFPPETPRSTSRRTPTKMRASSSTAADPLVELGLPSPLILGSGSFTRKLILKEMAVAYELVVRPIDEKGIGDREGDPATLVSILAKAKGDHLIASLTDKDDEALSSLARIKESEGEFGGWVVLTADQVVTHAGSILEKPESIEEAKDFVGRYAISAPKTVGAVVLTHIPSGIQVSGVDSAQINFRPSVAEGDLVKKLLEDDAPVLSCAGGLMVEHPLVQEHISSIDGTEDSVMGLSKELVLELLAELKERLKNN